MSASAAREDARPSAIFLMGPTASGKTALAETLALRYGLGVISVDSALVYRGLDIGSAKPDAALQARVPHRLIDLREPEQSYSAAEFRADALAAMQEFAAAGRVPLLVGGTGLYFRALERGLSELPEGDAALRERLAQEAAALGWGALHERLAGLDAVAAARIHRNDPQRIGRALEVIMLTGKPLSAQQNGALSRLPFRLLKLVVCPARGVLHQRIEQRFEAMLEAGMLDEVQALRRRPALTAAHPAMRAVGYRQAWQHLDGAFDRAELARRGVHATRQLAKRQITWLRAEYDARWFDPAAAEQVAKLEVAVSRFLQP